jgi:hypothetical protein
LVQRPALANGQRTGRQAAKFRAYERHHPPRHCELGRKSPLAACEKLSPDGMSSRSFRLIVKIVVIGGTGLIGSKVVQALTEQGHEARPESAQLNTV